MEIAFQQIVVDGDQNGHHGHADTDFHHQDAQGTKPVFGKSRKGEETVVQELSPRNHGEKAGTEVDENPDRPQRRSQDSLELKLSDVETGGQANQQQGRGKHRTALEAPPGAVMAVKDDIKAQKHDERGNCGAYRQNDLIVFMFAHLRLPSVVYCRHVWFSASVTTE